MNKTKRTAVSAWLDEQYAACSAREQQLCADDRAEEAAGVRIERDVYQSFRMVFAAAVKTAGEDDAALGDFFKQKLLLIPGTWHAIVQQAVKDGDLASAHIETIKLATAEEIKKTFYRLWDAEA